MMQEQNIPPIPVDSFWLPKAMSTIAPELDEAFYIVYWMSVAFFVVIIGAMVWFMYQYRRKREGELTSPIDHSFKLEVGWSLLPTFLLIWLFLVGIKGYANASVAPGNAMDIKVTAQMYSWTFTYPDGTITGGELGVPVNKPVRLVMSSKDVLHSFYVSNFRVKQDVVPGIYTTLWFEATETGEVPIQCAEYCGTGHSQMMGKVIVMEQAKFDNWLANGGTDEKLPPAQMGAKLFATRGCPTCHSLDGTRIQGPALNGVFGRSQTMSDGTTITADENYLRESILNPQAKLVQGYPGVMPAFQGQLTEEQVDALIAFLKEQK